MNKIVSRAMGIALGTAAFAIATGQALGASQSQTPSPPAAAQTSRVPAAQPVTITGCIQREADYRRASGAGRGGAAATGAGTGNEFVLANAMSSTSGSPAATSGANTPSPTGTAGSTMAYELTGSHEGDAASFVGKRVEITGTVKPSSVTGGPTANAPGSQDLKLSELEVSSIRETTGTCAAGATPAP